MIKFDQNDWLKLYINFNSDQRKKKARNNFARDFFKLINDVVLGKAMENARKYRDN